MIAWNRKTNEEFLEDLKDKGIKYIPLEPYIGASVNIAFQCNKCGHVWKARPSNILCGRGCPECMRTQSRQRLMYSSSEFENLLRNANPNIAMLSDYNGNKSKILVRCRKHGTEWWAYPTPLLRGCGCKECSKEKIHNKNGKPEEEFITELKKIAPQIEILGEYVNAHTKIKVRCKTHDVIYSTTPDLIVRGYGSCPRCKMTRGEHEVADYLEKSGYKYIPQYSFPESGIGNKRFDFYIPEINTCIEYDGLQHFEAVPNFGGEKALNYIKKNDEIKSRFCEEKGIKLIRIPYWEQDIEGCLKEQGI